MKIDILTLFPEMFSPLEHSIVGKAREKEYRESEYWTSNTKLILGGNHHYLQWSESEKIVTIIRELFE